jgi:hypothetical protein
MLIDRKSIPLPDNYLKSAMERAVKKALFTLIRFSNGIPGL